MNILESGVTRRRFGQGLAAVTAAGYSRILGANDKVHVGYIGLGNRGDQVHDAFLEHGDQQTVAVCDLREDYLDLAVKKSRGTPKRYKDYRKVLDDKSVDAVVIATPDHWHALMFVEACRAGKDVYVEKPLSLTVSEGRRMVQVAAETKRVTQVGTNRRSWKAYFEAADFIRQGGLGKVSMARAFSIRNEWPLGLGPSTGGTPTDFEWDKWLGPAPYVPYESNRAFYNFRWFYNYSGGQLTNFGVHFIDVIRWFLDLDVPKSVTAMGGHNAGIKDNREIPDTMQVMWEFDPNVLVTFTLSNGNGASGDLKNSEIEIRGTKGTMYVRNSTWEVVPEKISDTVTGYGLGKVYGNPVNREGASKGSKKAQIEARTTKAATAQYNTEAHTRNFLDCMKSRAKCNADVLIGHKSTSSTLIGNIAHKTRHMLEYDARTESFPGYPQANQYLSYKYRAPYKLG